MFEPCLYPDSSSLTSAGVVFCAMWNNVRFDVGENGVDDFIEKARLYVDSHDLPEFVSNEPVFFEAVCGMAVDIAMSVDSWAELVGERELEGEDFRRFQWFLTARVVSHEYVFYIDNSSVYLFDDVLLKQYIFGIAVDAISKDKLRVHIRVLPGATKSFEKTLARLLN